MSDQNKYEQSMDEQSPPEPAPLVLKPNQVASENPAFRDLDLELLNILNGYKKQRKAILIMMAIAVGLMFTFVLSPISFAICVAGAIMYLINTGNMIYHYTLVRRYRKALAKAGIDSTPVFKRAVAAKSTVLTAWIVATLPGAFALVWIIFGLIRPLMMRR